MPSDWTRTKPDSFDYSFNQYWSYGHYGPPVPFAICARENIHDHGLISASASLSLYLTSGYGRRIMLIRKNTKTFKTILEIISVCQGRADREKLIRLYITRAGHSINDRISVEGIQGDAALFYEMNYQSVLNNLQSSSHQLHISDEIPGIYFFHSSSNKVWDETPFEFDEAIKKEFSSLPELPIVRKKEKPEKFVFPTGKSIADSGGKKSDRGKKRKGKPEESGSHRSGKRSPATWLQTPA